MFVRVVVSAALLFLRDLLRLYHERAKEISNEIFVLVLRVVEEGPFTFAWDAPKGISLIAELTYLKTHVSSGRYWRIAAIRITHPQKCTTSSYMWKIRGLGYRTGGFSLLSIGECGLERSRELPSKWIILDGSLKSCLGNGCMERLSVKDSHLSTLCMADLCKTFAGTYLRSSH